MFMPEALPVRRSFERPIQRPVFVGDEERHFAKDGLSNTMSSWEDGARTDMSPGTFEWWYFEAHADDGTLIIIIFFSKPMIKVDGPPAPFVNVRIIMPDGKTHRVESSCDAGTFVAAHDRCCITVGANQVIGSLAGYHLHIDIDSVHCDLSFTPLAPPWRPGTGKLYFGPAEDRYFGWVVPMPSGSAVGQLEIAGKRRSIKGSGYHDHNWGTIALTKAWNSWWWSRARVGDFTVLAAELTTTPAFGSNKIHLLMVANGDRLYFDDSSRTSLVCKDLVHEPESRKNMPRALTFFYEHEGTSLFLSLRQEQELFRHNFLRKVPAWKKIAARLAGIDPWYYRFRGKASLHLTHQGISVIEEGTTIFERMCFGPDIPGR